MLSTFYAKPNCKSCELKCESAEEPKEKERKQKEITPNGNKGNDHKQCDIVKNENNHNKIDFKYESSDPKVKVQGTCYASNVVQNGGLAKNPNPGKKLTGKVPDEGGKFFKNHRLSDLKCHSNGEVYYMYNDKTYNLKEVYEKYFKDDGNNNTVNINKAILASQDDALENIKTQLKIGTNNLVEKRSEINCNKPKVWKCITDNQDNTSFKSTSDCPKKRKGDQPYDRKWSKLESSDEDKPKMKPRTNKFVASTIKHNFSVNRAGVNRVGPACDY